MIADTNIDPEMIQAYMETEYRVTGDSAVVLRVGEFCPPLDTLHEEQGADCSAFISACNPYSQSFDEASNTERHAALKGELLQRSLGFLEGVGKHPSNQWPGEPSYLIFGLQLEVAKTLGTKLEQNAIIWSGADAVPQLVLLT